MIRRAVTGVENGRERYPIANDFTSPLRGRCLRDPIRRLSTPSLALCSRLSVTTIPSPSDAVNNTAGPIDQAHLGVAALVALLCCWSSTGVSTSRATARREPTDRRRTPDGRGDFRHDLDRSRRADADAQATSVPSPTCAGAVWWYEAGDHVGAEAVGPGPRRTRPSRRQRACPLAARRPRSVVSRPDRPAVFVPTDRSADDADGAWAGRMVCVRGYVRQPRRRDRRRARFARRAGPGAMRSPPFVAAVVLPMFNEADNVEPLLERLAAVRARRPYDLRASPSTTAARTRPGRLSRQAPFVRAVRHRSTAAWRRRFAPASPPPWPSATRCSTPSRAWTPTSPTRPRTCRP